MLINNSISKYDWQYIVCASVLIIFFICTDLIGLFNKEILFYAPRKISVQPYRIFTSILIHADLNHLLSNLGGIVITRYFFISLGLNNKFFYLRFTLICSFLNFVFIWIFERFLFNLFNIYPNYYSLGFSGIIYALFGFILVSSFHGKSYFFNSKINLKSNYKIHKMSKTILLIGILFSLLPGVSLLGHASGFVAGCFLYLL
tara:strand:- start:573 stop:1178 length:606 start_codon:yes stop_codon:yes gene_type:complete